MDKKGSQHALLMCTVVHKQSLELTKLTNYMADKKLDDMRHQMNNTLYICGGFTHITSESKEVYSYNTVTESWAVLTVLQQPCQLSEKVALRIGSCIYVSGRGPYLHMYNIETGVWDNCSPSLVGISVQRFRYRIAALDGKIYMTGGRKYTESSTILDTCEAYNTRTKVCETLPPMSTKRAHHTMVSMKGKLYVFGGTIADRNAKSCLSSCECYDPTENKWKPIASLPKGRFEARACVLADNAIALMGGFSQKKTDKTQFVMTKFVNIYNPITDSWSYAPWKLCSPRHEFSVFFTRGRVYVCGGLATSGPGDFMNSNQSIDPTNYESGWKVHPSMPVGLANCAFATPST